MHLLTIKLILVLSTFQLYAQTIVYPENASMSEVQAAQEIRRYIFLRTGTAPEIAIADQYAGLPTGDVIVVSEDSRDLIT